jgi:hypothetical protein
MDIIFNLSIMLTFGFCSPILALAIGCACFFKIKMWTLFIGRLMCYFSKRTTPFRTAHSQSSEGLGSGSDADKFPYTLSALATTCLPIYDILDANMTILLRSSSIFLSLLVWDIAADDSGWRLALWAPATLLLVPVLCLWARRVLDRREREGMRLSGDDSSSDDIELKHRCESRATRDYKESDGDSDSSSHDSAVNVSNPILRRDEV